MFRRTLVLVGAIALGVANAAAADAARDGAMQLLAAKSGCLVCHPIETGAKGADGAVPAGPALREVAARYRAQKDAATRLTRTVMTGSNPYESHWKGKVSGLAMPPNMVTVREADARHLVDWILALDTKK